MSQQPHEPDQEPTGATQQQCQRPLHSLLHGPGGAVPQQPGQAVRPQRDGLPPLPPQRHGEGPAGGAVPHHRLPWRLPGQRHAGPEDPQPPRRRPPRQAERHGGHAARPPEQRALPPVQQVPRGPRGGGLRPRHLGQGRLPEEEDGLPAPGEVQAGHRAAGPGLLGVGGLGARGGPRSQTQGDLAPRPRPKPHPTQVPSAGGPRGPPGRPLPSGEDCAETQQNQNSRRRRGLDPASSGRCSRALGCEAVRGVWAGRGRGLRDRTEHVIAGDSGHRARQQGSGWGLSDPQRNDQRPCLRCPWGRLRKVWMGQPQGPGPQHPWASVRVGSGSRRKELWRETLPPLEHGGGAQASELLGRGFRKEVPGVQAPGEAEQPPAGLGGKTLEGREALRVRTGSPSSCWHLPAAQDGWTGGGVCGGGQVAQSGEAVGRGPRSSFWGRICRGGEGRSHSEWQLTSEASGGPVGSRQGT